MEKEIGAFITYLHNVKNTSGNTEMSYRRDLEKVSHFMESRGICEAKNMKAQDLTDYVRFLEDSKFAAATVSRNIASLKAFYHYMVQEGLVEEDIADKLKAPKIEKKAPEIMSPDEVVRLLEQPSGNTPKEIRDKAMLELLYATGIRVSECVGLDIEDVDFKNNRIKIIRKGGKEDFVYFGDEVADALSQYIQARKTIITKEGHEHALFLSTQKRRICVQSVENLVTDCAKHVTTIKHITPHKLRSTYGTSLYQETNDIYLVAEVLGHNDVNTTRKHYAALGEDRKRRAASAVTLRKD